MQSTGINNHTKGSTPKLVIMASVPRGSNMMASSTEVNTYIVIVIYRNTKGIGGRHKARDE
jgi:hypothetical protein